jgi:hypothetical protein
MFGKMSVGARRVRRYRYQNAEHDEGIRPLEREENDGIHVGN